MLNRRIRENVPSELRQPRWGPTGLASRFKRAGWGLVDQVFSSGSNFGLTLIAAQTTGPRGLGIVAIAFTVYLIALGFQRSLITDPLVVTTASLEAPTQLANTRKAIAVVLVSEATLAGVTATGAAVVPGLAGRAFLILSLWLVPVLLQDFARAVLFRDGRGRAAATTDVVWFLVMAAGAPFAWKWPSVWTVIGIWGAGGLAGALTGLALIGHWPARLKQSIGWWRTECWPFGRWLVSVEVLYDLFAQGTVLLLAGLLGSAALGGFRAVQTVFAPLSLLTPALSLPLLPILARVSASEPKRAIRLAIESSCGMCVAVLAYMAITIPLGAGVLGKVFGTDFRIYTYLIVPVAVQQLASAAGFGPLLLIKASQRGKAYLSLSGIVPLMTMLIVALGAELSGLRGAAWGFAVSTAIAAVLVWFAGIHRAPLRRGESEVAPQQTRL